MAKKTFIVRLFNDIAPTYDRLNHLLSLNIDKSWRKKAVRKIMSGHPHTVLDVACGTGDFSIALARAGVAEVRGIDISEGMLAVGRQKVEAAGLSAQVSMAVDDSEHLTLPAGSVDAVSVAFGVRNFEHLSLGLTDMLRVLRPGGQLLVLELSVPGNAVLLSLYKIYFMHILPFFGGLVSGNKAAYRYLPLSVLKFPKPNVFLQMLRDCGYVQVGQESLTFGLCRIYRGFKQG